MSTMAIHSQLKKNLQAGDQAEYENIELPVISTKRNYTNSQFLFAFAVCFVVMIPFTIILSWGTNINRFVHGYDRYGNICGCKNKPIAGVNCSGQDMTNRRFLEMRYYPINRCSPISKQKVLPYRCVDKCDPPNELIFNRCYPSHNVEIDDKSKYSKLMIEFLHAIYEYSSTIMIMTATGFTLTYGIFLCLRWNVGATFWSLTTFQMFASVASIYFFMHKYVEGTQISTLYLIFAAISIGYLLFIFLFIFILHDSFNFMYRLYDKTLDAIFKMPLILIQPLFTSLTAIIFSASIIACIMLVLSNGCLKRLNNLLFMYEYSYSFSMLMHTLYMLIMLIWTTFFLYGCQCFTVAGSMCQYYFSKDKSLQSPVAKSYKLLLRYHLGTVAFGSLIMTCFSLFGNIVEYLIRKIYIETALLGQSLWKSHLRLTKLMWVNFFHTSAITCFNCVISCGYFLVIEILTVGVGIWINLHYLENSSSIYYIYIAIFLGAVAASTMSYFVLGILNVATDATFLCLSEELLMTKEYRRNIYQFPELIKAAQQE